MRLPCPRTRASASPAMLLYGKNPNNAFLQCIKVLMFDAVALPADEGVRGPGDATLW